MTEIQTKTLNIISAETLDKLAKELFPKLKYNSREYNDWYSAYYLAYELEYGWEGEAYEEDQDLIDARQQESGDLCMTAEALINHAIVIGKLPKGSYLVDAAW